MTHPMIVHDAKEFAGVFYDGNRTLKFRATWPKEMDFVNACWQNFVVHVRSVYADMLTKTDLPQHYKDKIYDALIADAKAGSHDEGGESPLQLAPNTQAFEGDRRENIRTDEAYGKQAARLPLQKLLMMNSTAIRRVLDA